ncbi:hypothetical protein K439DRAFT_914764 [Ramaria rubella]|nr:hypothetical protein K439DRAFT_914764 [Ramaria rubella]
MITQRETTSSWKSKTGLVPLLCHRNGCQKARERHSIGSNAVLPIEMFDGYFLSKPGNLGLKVPGYCVTMFHSENDPLIHISHLKSVTRAAIPSSSPAPSKCIGLDHVLIPEQRGTEGYEFRCNSLYHRYYGWKSETRSIIKRGPVETKCESDKLHRVKVMEPRDTRP